MESPTTTAKPVSGKEHQTGHRERLRARVERVGAESLEDYELLEFLLAYARPRVDTKPQAKKLLKVHGSLARVLKKESNAIQRVDGIGTTSALLLQVVGEIAVRAARDEVDPKKIVFANWENVKRYMRAKFKGERKEIFHIFYLDAANKLLADETLSRGTVDRTAIYIREILERSLHHGATAIILTHNHPSGNPDPSVEDINMTREIAKAIGQVDIELHDHLIVGGTGKIASFKDLGLL